jgi:PAS domain S-box-containing protein
MPADDLSERAPTRGETESRGASQSPTGDERSLAAEDREREIAWRRGEERERQRLAGGETSRGSHTGIAPASVAARAFAALAENVRDYAIFLMDPDGVITFWGERARLIKWWTKDQAEGAHLRLMYPAGGSEDGTAEEHLRQAAERGEYTGEGHRTRNDCSVFWAGVTLTALWDEDGTLLGFAKVTRDLTARRAADALLRSAAETADSARASAEAADAAKSGFLATMSHEIRTPINAILGYVDLLSHEIEGTLTPQQKRFVARAGEASRHLLTLIDEVLDFSRLEVAQTSVARDVVRIGDAVSHALALVTPQARAKGIDLADAVGGYAAGLAAWADESRVNQILVNLLGNAVKFTMRRDGEAARVVISVGAAARPSPEAKVSGEGPWVYVRVEDTGPGIPSDRLTAVFEPFVQGDMSLARVHGGAGLGLAISRGLARLMGGDITARSEVGIGSTFFLWLPAAPVESLQTGGLPGHGPGGEEPRSSAPPHPAPAEPMPNGSRSASTTFHQEIADAILAEIERILHSYVARLRSDPVTPSAHTIDDSLIEDHLASFLADLAGTVSSLDVDGAEKEAGLRDGTAIQRAISRRHGAQRARLGWSEAELRREFVILREEVDAGVRRRSRKVQNNLGSASESARDLMPRVHNLLDGFLASAEQMSREGYRRTLDAAQHSDDDFDR